MFLPLNLWYPGISRFQVKHIPKGNLAWYTYHMPVAGIIFFLISYHYQVSYIISVHRWYRPLIIYKLCDGWCSISRLSCSLLIGFVLVLSPNSQNELIRYFNFRVKNWSRSCEKLLEIKNQLVRRVPGDLDSIHLTTPSPEGLIFFYPIFFSTMICVTIVPKKHTLISRQTT